MTIKNVIENFDIPDEICFSDIEPTATHCHGLYMLPMLPYDTCPQALWSLILLDEGKYLIFFGDKTNFVNEKIIVTINDDDIEEYLLISKEYRQHLRKLKIEKLNERKIKDN